MFVSIKSIVCLLAILNCVYAAIKPDKPGAKAIWKFTGRYFLFIIVQDFKYFQKTILI
jgi:hypothetical protein